MDPEPPICQFGPGGDFVRTYPPGSKPLGRGSVPPLADSARGGERLERLVKALAALLARLIREDRLAGPTAAAEVGPGLRAGLRPNAPGAARRRCSV